MPSETITDTAHPEQEGVGHWFFYLSPDLTMKARELSWERKCLSTNRRHAETFIYTALYRTLDLVLHFLPGSDTFNRHRWIKQMLQKLRNSEFWILNPRKFDSIETLVKTQISDSCLSFVTQAFCKKLAVSKPKPPNDIIASSFFSSGLLRASFQTTLHSSFDRLCITSCDK